MNTKPGITPKQGDHLCTFIVVLLMTAVMTVGMAFVHKPEPLMKSIIRDFLIGLSFGVPVGFVVVALVQWMIKPMISKHE